MSSLTLLFDLDGTLVDSVADLATAVNLLRADLELPPLTEAALRPMVGDGAIKLVQRAIPAELHAPDHLPRFLDHYRRHLTDQTRPYPGIVSLLEEFVGTPMAVVTNKPFDLAMGVLHNLALKTFFPVVIGGDSCREKKPHPLPLQIALQQLGGTPETAIMIGDHHTDLHAARAAGCRSCFCTWGIGREADASPIWRAASVVELAEILRDAAR
jgi:phosphoglycolate phosphatase